MKYAYSVKDIRAACEKMLNDAKDFDRADVYESGKELRAALDKLVSEFDKDTYNDRVMEDFKEDTECAALRLESILARVAAGYKERYLTRSRIVERYEQQKHDIIRYSMSGNADKASRLLADLHTLGRLASAVGHVEFYLTEEDVEFLELSGVHGLCASQR